MLIRWVIYLPRGVYHTSGQKRHNAPAELFVHLTGSRVGKLCGGLGVNDGAMSSSALANMRVALVIGVLVSPALEGNLCQVVQLLRRPRKCLEVAYWLGNSPLRSWEKADEINSSPLLRRCR